MGLNLSQGLEQQFVKRLEVQQTQMAADPSVCQFRHPLEKAG
jgi:hypothetical protein